MQNGASLRYVLPQVNREDGMRKGFVVVEGDPKTESEDGKRMLWWWEVVLGGEGKFGTKGSSTKFPGGEAGAAPAERVSVHMRLERGPRAPPALPSAFTGLLS